MMKETLNVPKISCDGCVNTIKKGLSTVDGLAQLEVDKEQKTVSFEPASEEAKKAAMERLEMIGYPAE